MKITINYVDIEQDQRLNEFVQKKVNKLETFYDRIVEGEVYLKRDRNSPENGAIAEIKLFVPGDSLFAQENAKSLEAAIDACTEAMRKQVIRLKEKQNAH
jgi:putative sigma-54 modulation protein